MGRSRSAARHAWEPAFLDALRENGKVHAAARAAGVTNGAPYNRRKCSPPFDAAWQEALADFRAAQDEKVRSKPNWIRRARGQWSWLDEVEQPLVEESESYLVGLGRTDQPVAEWSCTSPTLVIAADEAASLRSAFAGLEFWVRQRGSFALSHPLTLGQLS